MSKLIILSFIFSYSLFAFSDSCLDIAKNGAMTAHKSIQGPIKGSDAFSTEAELMEQQGNTSSYLVSISDNNKSQDTWKINYIVQTVNKANGCGLLNVQRSLIQPPTEAGVFRAQVDGIWCGQLNSFIIGHVCVLFLTRADKVKLGVLYNSTAQGEQASCRNVVINAHAISPILNKAVTNELRSYNDSYHYMYGTYFNEIFRVID